VLCTKITAITNKHFDLYIKGTYFSSLKPYADTHSPATPATPSATTTALSLAAKSPLITYAQVAAASDPLRA